MIEIVKMGKTKKAKISRPGQSEREQTSLPYQIAAETGVKASGRNKSRYKGDDVDDDNVDDQVGLMKIAVMWTQSVVDLNGVNPIQH